MNIRPDSFALKFARTQKARSSLAWLIHRGPLLALGSAGVLALLGCSRSDATAHANAPQVVRVVEIDATRHGADETMHYTGVVRARTESNLGFRVAGKIAERLVNAGDAVKKDQPLMKLDPVDYE